MSATPLRVPGDPVAPSQRISPAARGLSPGHGQYVAGCSLLHRLALHELQGLHHLTRWAAEGLIHAGHSAEAARILLDARWLASLIEQRHEAMKGNDRG